MATCSKGFVTLWVKLLIVSHHLSKYGVHRSCCNRDITDLIFHVTLQYHVIKVLCEFADGNSLLCASTLTRLLAIGIVVLILMIILPCHVTLQDHVIL